MKNLDRSLLPLDLPDLDLERELLLLELERDLLLPFLAFLDLMRKEREDYSKKIFKAATLTYYKCFYNSPLGCLY
jgi:hypothetical protein